MTKKMNFQDVIDIFAMFYMEDDGIDKNTKTAATRKGHKHAHRPARKPSGVLGKFYTTTTPAEWRQQNMGKA
jgi:hypothetical protein